MGQAKRRSPDAMPSADKAKAQFEGLDGTVFVAGSRGEERRRSADYDIHGHPRYSFGTHDDSAGKHVILFTHGYNVTANDSLRSAADLFGMIQTTQKRKQVDLTGYAYGLFTWPGDVGPLWFGDAQEFAQHSGAALYEFVTAIRAAGAAGVTLITHSLGAHVGLRSAAILGERLYSNKGTARYDNVLLLAPAVEDDVFERPNLLEEYHFTDAPFGIDFLHIFMSRGDDVLKNAFFASELDKGLGYTGPQSMSPLKTMCMRVPAVLKEATGRDYGFRVQLHDFSPRSTTIMNPELHVHSHSDYWSRQPQVDYYHNYLG